MKAAFVISPDDLPPAANYVAAAGVASFDVGAKWLMIVTLNGGRQREVRDLNPGLPLIVRY